MRKSALAIGLGWRLAGKMSKQVALFSWKWTKKSPTASSPLETGIDGDR